MVARRARWSREASVSSVSIRARTRRLAAYFFTRVILMTPKTSKGGNPHKQRRATVAPVRGKETGKAVGQSVSTKHAGEKNVAGTTDRVSY